MFFFDFLYIIFMLIGKLYIEAIHKEATHFYKKKRVDFLRAGWYHTYEDKRLATSDCSPLAQFVLNKRDISEE